MNKGIYRICLFSLLILIFPLLTSCGRVSIPDKFNYDDFSEYIRLGNYKNLVYRKADISVSDETVEKQIKSELSKNAKTENVTEGTVTESDIVNVDYEGTIDGKKSDNATASDQTIDITKDSYIEGFTSSMVGRSVGETYTVELSFPANYQVANLRGKPVTFKITINSIVRSKLPELTDDYCKSHTEYKTVDEYRKSVRRELERTAKNDGINGERQELFDRIKKGSEFIKLPEVELNAAKDKIKTSYKKLAGQYNVKYEDYIKTYLNMSEDEFNDEVNKAAENMVKQELILYALADELEIEISEKEYNDYIDKLIKRSGYDSRESFEKTAGTTIKEYADENNIFQAMLFQQVMDRVKEMGKATQ